VATEFGILGPLSMTRGSDAVEVRGPRQRALLALLLIHANQIVPADRIADLLWRGEPPRTATNTLQTHIVRLRRALKAGGDEEGGALRTVPNGYLLEVDHNALDSARFETLLAEARRAVSLDRHAVGHEMLRRALGLWRGSALAEFASEPFALADAARLDELHIDAQQEYAATAIACGRVAEAITTLQPLVDAHPLREQPVGHLMVALYRAGRQADALNACRSLRVALRDELGLDPSHELQRLEQSILDQADNLELVSIGASPRAHALPPAALVADPPFVGRTEELAWVGAQWHAACRGEPRLAIVQGEPGIGKTRIAAEFAERCYRGGTTVLWGSCTDDPGVPFDALASALGPLVGSAATTTPLWQLFGVPDDLALHGDPELERYRMFQAVADLLDRTARDAPVLLVLDDLQWADRSTLALLAHFLRAAPPVCVLVLATVRATELPSSDAFLATVAELTREGRAESRVIGGLAVEHVESLIRHLLPAKRGKQISVAVTERTGGNPLFVTALMRHMDDTGDADLEQVDLPDTVRAVIDRRIAHLDPAALEILQTAAVVGVEFDATLVEAVTQGSRATFARLLDEICAAGLAQPCDDTGRVYVFAHALIRDVLYRGVGSARRALMHQNVADAFEGQPDDGRGDRAAQLARLFAAVPSREAMAKAVTYAARAGEDALTSLAYEDAYSHFDMALGLIDRAEVDVATRADLQFARARASFACGERARAKADFEQVAIVYRELGDPERLTNFALGISGTSMRHLWSDYGTVSDWVIDLVREALAFNEGQETSNRVRLLARLAEELYFSPDDEARTAIAEEALAIGRRLDDAGALADALNGRLRALWHPANASERLRTARELRDLALVAGDAEQAMAGEAWSIVSQLELAGTPEAAADIDAAVLRYAAMADEYRSPRHRVWSGAIRGGRALARGEFEETERLIGDGMSVAPEVFGYAIQGFAGQLCTLRIEQGRAAEVLDAGRDFVAQYPQVPAWRAGLSVILAELGLLDEAREQLAVLAANGLGTLRRDQEWLFSMGAIAETCSTIGASDIAVECYELLSSFADRCIVLGDGYVLWCSAEKSLGILARTAGRPLDACRHLDRALAVHQSLGAHPLVARTAFEYARALHEANADPELVALQLTNARRRATQLGQFGLLRSIEVFTHSSNTGARA
jgi:DNA-binding SARP family transcriptional activator/tetratricopeptide (TPR) repeat protein